MNKEKKEDKLKEIFSMEKDNIECLNENYWFGTKKADYWHNKEVNLAFRKGIEQTKQEIIKEIRKIMKKNTITHQIGSNEFQELLKSLGEET